MTNTRGFTLLEVMVAISILALSLVAIGGINANSFESSNYAKHLTVATLLARSKMIDIEEDLRKNGFGNGERNWDGDFSEEGYSELRWTAVARPVDIDVGQLLGPLLGGEVSSDKLPEQMQAFLGAMNGELPAVGDEASKYAEEVGGSDLKQLMGGEQMELIFKQVGETLGDSIREITVEIEWGKAGVDLENVKFVQYVTTTGRLSFQAPPAGPTGNTVDTNGDGIPDAPAGANVNGSPLDHLLHGTGLQQNGALTPNGRNPFTGGLFPPTLPGGSPNPVKEGK